jgi:hypothetical protein
MIINKWISFFISYYHQKDKFSQLLEVLSSEIVNRAKQIITKDISSETETSMGLKDALSICAMFRGTYLDYKEKADALNSKYMIPEKKFLLIRMFFIIILFKNLLEWIHQKC